MKKIEISLYSWNEYRDTIYQGKYYSKTVKIGDKYEYRARRSKIALVSDCPLTGVCCDYDILEPIIRCLDGSEKFDDPESLFSACFDSFFSAWRDEIEYCAGFEFFDDMVSANFDGQLFTERGDLW